MLSAWALVEDSIPYINSLVRMILNYSCSRLIPHPSGRHFTRKSPAWTHSLSHSQIASVSLSIDLQPRHVTHPTTNVPSMTRWKYGKEPGLYKTYGPQNLKRSYQCPYQILLSCFEESVCSTRSLLSFWQCIVILQNLFNCTQ